MSTPDLDDLAAVVAAAQRRLPAALQRSRASAAPPSVVEAADPWTALGAWRG